MKFRTEIGPIHGSFQISHDDHIVLLGSCFADNIGNLLHRDGFDVVHNPLGPLFNPMSIEAVLSRKGRLFTPEEFIYDNGEWHCLAFAHRYRHSDALRLLEMVNSDYLTLHSALEKATVIILTFGTTGIFCYGDSDIVAGNCHKLPAKFFNERNIGLEEITRLPLCAHYPQAKKIVTLSPVRYPGRGLPAGNLAKATLRVAIDRLTQSGNYDYFPSYEIVTDDLRDYRFYAADMRHPSDTAVEYIYDCFAQTYFSPLTQRKADECRREALRAAHIPFK